MRPNRRQIVHGEAATVLAAEAGGSMTTGAIHGSRANPAGSPFRTQPAGDVYRTCPLATNTTTGIRMPRGPSTFTKRHKEQTRQQRQRDKAERRNLRKQESSAPGGVAEMAELHQHPAAQAARFNIGVEEIEPVEESAPDCRIGE